MIFRFLPVIGDAPDAVLILLLAFTVTLLLGLAFHEFMHAFVADRLGDPTPRAMGRLTLDPRAHFDPVGSTLIFFAGFGWANLHCLAVWRKRDPDSAHSIRGL